MTDDEAQEAEATRLGRLFRHNPIWLRAAQVLDARATSDVYFLSMPDRVWHLAFDRGVPTLFPGRSGDPDLVFRFSRHAIERLERAAGDVDAYALALFELIVEPDTSQGVELRVKASFLRLARRGYLRLLLGTGARVRIFASRHGVASLRDLQRIIGNIVDREPADWERGDS